MRSNVLTAVGVLIMVVFVGLLSSWEWAGLVTGAVLVGAGWSSRDVEGGDGGA